MKNSSRVPEIDGLRALAIALVLGFHAGLPFLWVDSGGMTGVDIFFVISGFVITSTLQSHVTHDNTKWIKKFYLRRFIRLSPALFTVVLISLPIGLLVFHDRAVFLENAIAALTYTYPIFAGLFSMRHLGFGHTWTLALEEYFYLAFPIFLYFAAPKFKREVIAGILASVSLIGLATSVLLAFVSDGHVENRWYGLASYMRVAAIGLGCALNLLMVRVQNLKLGTRFVNLLALLLFVSSLLVSQQRRLLGVSWLLADFAALLFIIVATSESKMPIQRFLSSRFMTWVGGISYELYLWHAVLLEVCITFSGIVKTSAALITYPISILFAWLTKTSWSRLQEKWRHLISEHSE